MTKQEYIQTLQEHYQHNWKHLLFGHTIIPSQEVEGWSLSKKDENDATETRLQFLEDLVVKMREEIKDIQSNNDSLQTQIDFLRS